MYIFHIALLILATSKSAINNSLNKQTFSLLNITILNKNNTIQTNTTKNIGIQNSLTNINKTQQQDVVASQKYNFLDLDFDDKSDITSSAQIGGYKHAQKARRRFRRTYTRAQLNKHKEVTDSNTSNVSSSIMVIGESSTSKEVREFQQNWKTNWQQLKRDAIKAHLANKNYTAGMKMNMAAAKPWRVPCGDVNQFDVPVGTCTLPFECPAEFRMYRADVHCKILSRFICCAVQKADYDMYQGIEASIEESSDISTSSAELERRQKGSRERRHRKRRRARYRLTKAKYRRKRKLKRTIRRLQKAVRKELNRAFRNNTHKRHKTKLNLLTLIAKLKKKTRNERYIAKQQHDRDLKRLDGALLAKLDKILDLNHHFLMNDTFREIIMKGYMSPAGARMLIEAYPDLEPDLIDVASLNRRSGGGAISTVKELEKPNDYMDYDIEIGVLDYLNRK